ncbi:hypothetical protein TNCV_2580121 [Trichonephila clavipes]|uniref:Uncharacterized protein n=1 Tax=Trichonephila clavipes TaxID=2585209 RepID=A0A8X6SB39_TRICX|nr:hypothetical protein TNCV_2580121 [Trichonephila clavipes]
MRKGPLTAINLQLMVIKFEETGSLNVRSGRGIKPVSAEAKEKVALQVKEDKTSNVQASTSVRLVAEALDLPRSTVHHAKHSQLLSIQASTCAGIAST